MAGDTTSARLVGWKSIGAFLGVDARTAKRWEHARGLPVRRLPGDGSATVWASRDDLRAWLAPLPLPAPEADTAAASSAAGLTPPPGKRLVPRAVWLTVVAVGVAGGIGGAHLLTPDAPAPSMAAAYDDAPDARRAWLAGRFALATRSASGIAEATRAFEGLTRRFPNRAPAYAALAEAHLVSREFGTVPDEVAYPAAGRAARIALTLDRRLGDAWLDQAFVKFWWEQDLGGGLAAFREAVVRSPGSAKAHHWYATAASAVGDVATARSEIAKAQALEPNNHAVVADAAMIELSAGNIAEARAALMQFVRLDPGLVAGHRYLAIAHLIAGDDAGFLDEQAETLRLRGAVEGLAGIDVARRAFAGGGRTAMLDRLSADAATAARDGSGSAAAVARLRALARDRAGMLRWMAVSAARREPEAIYLAGDPALLAWRRDPAVKAFGHAN